MKKEQRLLTEILEAGGLLSKVVEGYESRPQQLTMGDWILEALEMARILLVEAPTGVGKTMAYLVPAALYARSKREPVVISSFTKALQDQILRIDGPRLKRLVHPDLKLVALKGRSNYLCRRRWDLFVSEEGSGPDGQWVVDKLGNWVENTATGAFAKAPDLGPRGAWVYARIGGHPRFCRSRLCRPESGCFHKLARREARSADLIVVNHSLLLADVFGGGILPEFEALIIDEAHALPGAALDPLSIEISERGLDDRIRSMGGVGEPGASDRLRRVLKRLPSTVAAKNLNGQIREFEKKVRETLAASREFFVRLHQAPGFPREGDRRRYTMQDCLGDLMPSETEQFLGAARSLAKEGTALLTKIEREFPGEVPDETQDMLDATEMLIDELSGDIASLESLIAPVDAGRVNVMASTKGAGASLSSIPLDPGPAIREHLLDKKRSVTLTSATLATGTDFSYFSRQIGLELGEPMVLQLPSPFPLQKQLMVMTPTFAIDPREEGYAAFLSKTIGHVVADIGRKTLVLFTSYHLLNEVQRNLEVSPRMKGIELIVQSRSKPRSKVADDFRAAKKAVLLGTASFWQGIDFPGKDLEVLIVTRLPFPVPTDPRVEALSEAMEEEGRNSFREFSLPEAVLKMRQGIGRLIRRADDKGVCLILDPRLMRARYGNVFRAAMPVKPESPTSLEAMVTQIRDWFKSPETK